MTIEHLLECWACRSRAYTTSFLHSFTLSLEWKTLSIRQEIVLRESDIKTMRLSEEQTLDANDQQEFQDRLLNLEEQKTSLRATMVHALAAFKADRLAYLYSNSAIAAAAYKKREPVDQVAIGIKTSIRASSRSAKYWKCASSFGPTLPTEVIELCCLSLYGLQSEFDDLPFNVPDCLIAGHVSALLSLVVRMNSFGPSEEREWHIRIGEFNRDWQRLEKWIKKNHPFHPKTSSPSLLKRIISATENLSRAVFLNIGRLGIPTTPIVQDSPKLPKAHLEKYGNELSPVAVPKGTENVNAVNHIQRTETGQGNVALEWQGPLVDAESVSRKLCERGREITAQTLKNSYWHEWKPHDHKRGKAYFFYWDRIQPIVERQFCVKFEEQ